VVKHLQTVFGGDSRVAITCIYLNYKEQNEQTVSNLIASLLKQMVQDQPTTSANIKAHYEYHRDRSTRPILNELIDVLKLEIETYSKVFIVVDALDECERHETRENLYKVLRSFTTAGTVRLLITSRAVPSIAKYFQRRERLDIQAHNHDIKKYLEGRIAAGPQHIKQLQEIIASQIVQSAEGM
jgi:hypothetical protein